MYIHHLEACPGADYSETLNRIANALERISQQLEGNTIPNPNKSSELFNESIPDQGKPKEVLTVNEAAEILRISLPSMYSLAEAGEIRSVRVGRRVLLSRTSLMEFISGKKTATE